jgi:hypothetical protein
VIESQTTSQKKMLRPDDETHLLPISEEYAKTQLNEYNVSTSINSVMNLQTGEQPNKQTDYHTI